MAVLSPEVNIVPDEPVASALARKPKFYKVMRQLADDESHPDGVI